MCPTPEVATLKVGQALRYDFTGNVVIRLDTNSYVKLLKDGSPALFRTRDEMERLFSGKGEAARLLPEGTQFMLTLGES